MVTTELQSLLQQLVYIIVPLLLYQAFSYKLEGPRMQHVMQSLLYITMAFLCMIDPVQFDSGARFDLRSVAVFLCFLYASRASFIATACFFVVFRLWLGDLPSALIAMTALSIPIALSFLRIQQYHNSSLAIKAAYLAIIVLLMNVIRTPLLYMMNPSSLMEHLWFQVAFYPMLQFAGFLLAIMIIETLHTRTRLDKELQETERIKVVGQMAASIAHEVRNPLTVVRGFVQLFQMNPAMSEDKKREYLRLIMDELHRAEAVIKDYLSLARTEESEHDTVDIHGQVHLLVKTLANFAAMHGVRLVIEAEEELYVHGDQIKTAQVLVNLIKNAIEATLPKPADRTVLIRATKGPDHTVHVLIKDNGIGMPHSMIKRLGTAFLTGKEQGTGLGLTVCYHIVKSMGGTISVESKEQHGTSFTVQWPSAGD